MGEKQNRSFQFCFNGFLEVDFQGSRVTSDGGLILIRELDEHLEMNQLIEQHLTDSRRGKNTQLPLADLLRQSVYSRLAGYEDVNDAERVSVDPTFRLIGSEKIWDRGAALTSRLQSFETELLAEPENLTGLSAINRALIAKAEAIDSPQRVVLDIDSTEIPVYGQQENSAYNGHFESTCYHPLLLFNREGDCLAAKLRPGNVHSADDWEEVLMPEIQRQHKRGKEVVVRADAAFAKPEIYETLEQLGVDYAIRIPANENLERDIAEFLPRPVGRPSKQAPGGIQEFSLPGSELDEGPPSGVQSGASPGRVVPASGLYRDEFEFAEPGTGAVLQQARDSRTMNQRGQAGGEDDTAELPSLPIQRSALAVEPIGLQPGEPVAATGAAQEDRSLVADQLATAVSEDGRAIGETRPLLLALAGRRSSDAAGVRGDSSKDLGAAPADWIGWGGREGNRLKEGGWDGEVSKKSLAMSPCGHFSYREEADLAPFLGYRSRSDGQNSRSRHKQRWLGVQ